MNHFNKLKLLLVSTAVAVAVGGCQMFGSNSISASSVQKSDTTYLCELAIENTRTNIKNILDSTERTPKNSLRIFYDAYKNNLINIQYECPEDNQEAWGVQDTEPLVDSIMEYKYKDTK